VKLDFWAVRAKAGFAQDDKVLGRWADVAQLVEHSLGKGEVISSILIIGSMRFEFSIIAAKFFGDWV
jgi:hypothetical protein